MAKKTEKLGDTVETLRPYLERALRDDEFRKDLKDALAAAREIYGDLSKKNGGVRNAAMLAMDKDTQEHLKRALEDIASATDRVKGTKKKKKHRGRKTLLVAGVIAGALYNPWTGPQTRLWITEKVGGDDDLQPVDWDLPEEAAVSADVESAADEPAAAASSKKTADDDGA
jgi:hypothetical protein